MDLVDRQTKRWGPPRHAVIANLPMHRRWTMHGSPMVQSRRPRCSSMIDTEPGGSLGGPIPILLLGRSASRPSGRHLCSDRSLRRFNELCRRQASRDLRTVRHGDGSRPLEKCISTLKSSGVDSTGRVATGGRHEHPHPGCMISGKLAPFAHAARCCHSSTRVEPCRLGQG